MTRWLVRFIPAATLLATALILAVVGVVLPFGDAATGGGSGQIRPGTVAFGAALIAAGAALAWLAWGVWRGRPWPTHIALVVSTCVLAALVWIAVQAPTPMGTISDPHTNQQIPQYDTGGQRIAPAIVPYALAVICLVESELRWRARPA